MANVIKGGEKESFMTTTKKIETIVKTTATTAITTAINSTKGMAMVAPISIAITATVNKVCDGAWDIKGAATSVAKKAAVSIAVSTAANAAVAATLATISAVKEEGIFADDNDTTPVEEFDWDEEVQEA